MNPPKPNGQVHPIAAMFPMMPEDELQELTSDIAANGLIQPIVLDTQGTLLDGRNRQEACKRADVKAAYTVLDGQDPVAFILASNVTRRHLTKGQQAMVIAKTRLLSNHSTREAAKQSGLSQTRIAQACLVLQYANDLADTVLAGLKPLNEAYAIAQERKEASESNEAWMIKLRIKAPDLADQVVEERLSLAESKAAYLAREKEERDKAETKRQERRLTTEQLETALKNIEPCGLTPPQRAMKLLDLFEPSAATSEVTAERIKQCHQVLGRLAEIWPAQKPKKQNEAA